MNFRKLRLTHLLDHISKDFELLCEYENLAENAEPRIQ